jgi:hypothetical protein
MNVQAVTPPAPAQEPIIRESNYFGQELERYWKIVMFK